MTFLVTSLVGHAEFLFQIGIHWCFFWFGVQSRRFISAFRGIVVSFWHLKSLIISQLDVQSHYVFSSITLGVIFLSLTLIVISFGLAFRVVFCFVWRLDPHLRSTFGVTFFSIDVQSHHCHFFIWRSEPSSFLNLGIQSCILSFSAFRATVIFSVSVFRAIIVFSVWCSESSSSLFS